jgi:hypothetical protein
MADLQILVGKGALVDNHFFLTAVRRTNCHQDLAWTGTIGDRINAEQHV